MEIPREPKVVAGAKEDPREPGSVVQSLGQGSGLLKQPARPLDFPQRQEGLAEVEAEIDAHHRRFAALRELIERLPRLLIAAQRLPVSRPRRDFLACLAEVVDGLVPRLAAERMMGQPLDVIGQPVRIGVFDGTKLGDEC